MIQMDPLSHLHNISTPLPHYCGSREFESQFSSLCLEMFDIVLLIGLIHPTNNSEGSHEQEHTTPSLLLPVSICTCSTAQGMYKEGCGISNLLMSWGHNGQCLVVIVSLNTTDSPPHLSVCPSVRLKHGVSSAEYLYQVLKNHTECRLPEEALWCIRFHSFFPWHTEGDYKEFETEGDDRIRKVVYDFRSVQYA